MTLIELFQAARAEAEREQRKPENIKIHSYIEGRKDELDYWIEFIQKNNENIQIS